MPRVVICCTRGVTVIYARLISSHRNYEGAQCGFSVGSVDIIVRRNQFRFL
jgi:hypothetical protein